VLRRIAPVAVAAIVLATVAALYWYRQREPFDLSGPGCVVLAYHRIIPRPNPLLSLLNGLDDYTLYRDDFQQQIQSLKAAESISSRRRN